MQYSDKAVDHFNNPRNVGNLDENDSHVGTGVYGAPECGDLLKLQIKVDDDQKIEDVKFKTFGCCAAIASGSLTTEKLKGLTLEEARHLSDGEIAKELELPPMKVHCSVMAEKAINLAIDDYEKKHS